MTTTTAARLREIPSLIGSPPNLDLDALPTEPVELFEEWLNLAIETRVQEPIAVTLSTVGEQGLPDSRTLVLKAVDAAGWAFAGTASSRKGQQLQANPGAAMNVWWQPLMRAVRIRGKVVAASTPECEADLAARSEQAQSGVAPGDWRLWRLQPSRVEFWQGSVDRRHLRVVYTLDGEWQVRITRGESDITERGREDGNSR